ncbi:hypothetical protein FNV43_RR03927 [Rhamnella rubrinervis]|uniref:Uncharacterized protein n=1 Tax=Rhamnella rubrinervis TaxID=2594499 RepID=A0A8K0MPB4_9ROSA|nr:hypothetical protein FNV43_RR03927 [Rhamnella rubrinervis]
MSVLDQNQLLTDTSLPELHDPTDDNLISTWSHRAWVACTTLLISLAINVCGQFPIMARAHCSRLGWVDFRFASNFINGLIAKEPASTTGEGAASSWPARVTGAARSASPACDRLITTIIA